MDRQSNDKSHTLADDNTYLNDQNLIWLSLALLIIRSLDNLRKMIQCQEIFESGKDTAIEFGYIYFDR